MAISIDEWRIFKIFDFLRCLNKISWRQNIYVFVSNAGIVFGKMLRKKDAVQVSDTT